MLTTIVTALMPASAPAMDNDHALVRASIGGDTAAFEALYRRHAGRVHGVISRLLGRRDQHAEDLTQEAFVRAWQALASYRFESAFGTWLYRLAANTALIELRRHRGEPAMVSGEEHFERIGHADSAGHTTALAMDLAHAVATLPPRARAVLVLHDIEGWTHGEIGDALDMATGTSKAQLHRARGLLRARLGDMT